MPTISKALRRDRKRSKKIKSNIKNNYIDNKESSAKKKEKIYWRDARKLKESLLEGEV